MKSNVPPAARRHASKVTQASRLRLLFLLLLLPSLSYAGSPIHVSILSILQPTGVIVTLQQPDRAMLRAPLGNNAVAANAPLRISLQKGLLEIGPATPASSLSIDCSGPCLFELEIPNKIKRQYKGALSLNARESTISIVLHTSEEDLLASIVASEMGAHRQFEALEAFAVVARSFLHAGNRHPELGADFCDLTHCQVFQAYAPSPEALEAVRRTSGLVLTFRQQPFRPYYSGSCGGRTASFAEVWKKESPEYPFASVKCPCNARWDTSLQQQELDSLAGFTNSRMDQQSSSIVLRAGTKRVEYSLEDFRTLAGRLLGWNRIRSNAFVATQNGSTVIITGTGIGHRVGLCQTGSVLLANQGKTFEEILRHYFPNTEIRTR